MIDLEAWEAIKPGDRITFRSRVMPHVLPKWEGKIATRIVLRRSFEGVIVRADGYRLEVAPDEIIAVEAA